MSREFREKNKDLVNLQVMPSAQVWHVKGNGTYALKKDLDIYGRIDKGTSTFITSTNLKGERHKIVEDTCNLPKKTKNEIVKLLKNENKSVVYLIKKNNRP